MDELLKEFWAAWKRWDMYRTDAITFRSQYAKCQDSERDRMWWPVIRLADNIRAAERAALRPAPAPSDDVPGQLYFTDLSKPIPRPEAARSVA